MLKIQHMGKDKPADSQLSRRERQVMDILYRRGAATVAEVMAELPEPPTYSAVRSILRILADKGAITHREDGPRYVYLPAVSPRSAQEQALRHMVRTFFDGSAEQAVSALLRLSDGELDDAELKRLRDSVRKAKNSGR